MKSLFILGGQDIEEPITWDFFLFILLKFCELSKVELCQCLFMMIVQILDSKKHHYLSMQDLIDFYAFYGKCPVTSFNTRAVDFTRLPLRRYYASDFTELVQRFAVLLNPLIHMQRSLQECMPGVGFWDDYHREEVICRKITPDFFLMEKTRCFLWGEPPFRESCDTLAPEALGFNAINKDQWDMRTFDLHERVGALSEGGSFSKNGEFQAPVGFQYRSLRQFSVWGEQPSPEDTERMMLADNDNVYLTSAGYIAQHVEGIGTGFADEEHSESGDEADEDEMERAAAVEAGEVPISKAERKLMKKKKAEEAARLKKEGDPLGDPTNSCLQACVFQEDHNPPPKDMPPLWMKSFAIAPAPRLAGPDVPLRERDIQAASNRGMQATTFGASTRGGGQAGKGGGKGDGKDGKGGTNQVGGSKAVSFK